MSEHKRLAEFSNDQHGNITSKQARASGLTGYQIAKRVEDRVLERAGSHVLRSPYVERTPTGDLAALLLDAGDGAVASGQTALALHGFEGMVLASPFDVTLPRGRFIDRPPHHIHTTIDLPASDRTRVHGVPCMTAVRAIIDASKQMRPATLTIAYDGGLRDRKFTEDLVHTRIVELRKSGRPGIGKLIDVIEGGEITRGGASWLERRFLEICARHRLPRPATQQVLTSARGKLVRVDFRFPGTNVVGEVLGYRYHRGDRAQFSRDVERMNALIHEGFAPLQFTYDHVTLDEAWVVSQLRQALGR